MLPSLVGAVAIIAGCTAMGFYFAAKEGFRLRDLQEFKKALMILSSEIEHMRTPLPLACANIAKRTAKHISELFRDFSGLLEASAGETAYQLWTQALERQKPHLYLSDEDLDIVEGFGKTLGYLDKEMQQSAIDYAVTYIDDKAAGLISQADKNKRMYRSLGVIGGLLLAIVLW